MRDYSLCGYLAGPWWDPGVGCVRSLHPRAILWHQVPARCRQLRDQHQLVNRVSKFFYIKDLCFTCIHDMTYMPMYTSISKKYCLASIVSHPAYNYDKLIHIDLDNDILICQHGMGIRGYLVQLKNALPWVIILGALISWHHQLLKIWLDEKLYITSKLMSSYVFDCGRIPFLYNKNVKIIESY